MLPATSTVDLTQYDFSAKENESKWKGLFLHGLRKVSQKVGHSMNMKAKEDALDYLERLLLQLLGMLCCRPAPHSVTEVQDRVQKMFPPPIDKWAIDEAASAVRQGKKKTDLVHFPVEKIHPLLQKDVLLHKVDHNVTVYLCAVLQYVAADILLLVGNYVKHSRHGELSTQDVKAAMCCDKVLCDLFKLGDNVSVSLVEEPVTRNSLSYNEVVDDVLQSERQYLRDLQMLIKVFREQLANKLASENENLELVFQSIEDITELTITLISTLEDTLEMTEPNQVPAVGICFLELAENWEFDIYDRYAEAFNENCQQMLEELLSRPDIEATVSTAGHGFVEAVKFYFPKLLLEPFYHCMQYFDYIKLLRRLSPSSKDNSDLLQAEGVLTPLKTCLENLKIPKKSSCDLGIILSGKGNKQIAKQKVIEIKGQVEGFNDSLGQSYFNEFYTEGELQKIGSGRKPSERYGYLFDGFMFLCKPNYRRTSVVTGGYQHEYRLKESFYLTKVEVKDLEDTDECKNLFEILPRDQPPVILSTRSPEEKCNWMAILVMLTTKSMLDRILDRILSDEEKKHPLKLPPPEKYRFAVEDLETNIVLDKDNGNHFLIKGATLLKLVERLTHHQYSDPNFINTFLTTYRSFCTPHEFLDLLIERYSIPDPEVPLSETESIHTREMLKRFRKEYSRHIRLRVLNVIKQWVVHHFYDFERDPDLQGRLEAFLDQADESKGKNCIFESVRKCLRKAAEHSSADLDRSYSAVRSPPPLEYHIKCPVSEWTVLTLHPIELARQLTLLEFEYYRVVKPSELVGSVWTKKNKEQSSPNLLRMIKHTTNVTRWFEKTIVDTENLEERIAVVSRILEVMMVLQELNNFNGVLAVVSAMGSASVHRLNFTFQGVVPKMMKALEEAQELQNDHYKKYQERLRSINPPCVPFFGMYLTNILHIEEGNLDFLPNSNELINFGKRRKVAEITSEIRQFQYSHYCFAVETRIREFIEKLQPFEADTAENEISNYLYEKSLEIEPRGAKQLPKFQRKWPDLNLKSPGIKPRHLPGRSHPPGPLMPPSASSSFAPFHSSHSISSMRIDSELESVMDASPQTPKTLTPSSIPSTTSPFDRLGDFSVFAPVLIGPVPNPPNMSPLQNSFSHSHHSLSSIASSVHPAPPPLPPRRKRDGSIGDSLSPRADISENPPPLPPRKVSPRTPNAPNPPVPRRNSATTSSECGLNSPALNQQTVSSPKRLTPNGPPSVISSHSPAGYNCGSEHSHPAFVFNQGPPLSPVRSKPPVAAPKLPPKTSKPINVNSANSNHNQLL